MKTLLPVTIAAVIWVAAAYAYSSGPDPRYTGAPGDAPDACSSCHGGSPNTGPGSVKIAFPGTTYTPGAKHHIVVQVSDPNQQRWGFQFTARLNSDLANGQAGDLNPTDSFTQVICDNGFPAPCPAGQPVEFIEHTTAGTRLGTPAGASFEFDWTAPAAGAGSVTFYAAGNAANGNGDSTGDVIYTTSLQVDPAQGSTTGGGSGGPALVSATRYAQHNLVSDVPGLADQTDPNLTNPWGVSMNASGPFWISNNRSGTSTLYDGAGNPFPAGNPRVVRIPPAATSGKPASPTAQVYNPTAGFEIASGKPATFLFAAQDGTISGWNSSVDPVNAVIMVDNSGAGAVYKGLALGVLNGAPVLYAANFASGTVDVFDAAFKPLAASGGFQDPNLPAGFAPFNIQRCGARLLVAYARQDNAKRNDVPGPGNGYIDAFDLNGNLKQQLVAGGPLNSPWGMALAPGFFGDFSFTLLVGNFGDGTINAFDPSSGQSLGPLTAGDGKPLSIEGLWALVFGNGHSAGDANTLYFTAGISGGGNKGDHGLFGAIGVGQ